MPLILVADNNDAVRHALRKLLEAAEHTVFEAVDGLDALEQAGRNAPDLVILDASMPKLSGIEAASIIKAKFPTVPIILLTLHDIGQSLVAAAGISAVVGKADGADKLIDCVRKFLRPQSQDYSDAPLHHPVTAESAE